SCAQVHSSSLVCSFRIGPSLESVWRRAMSKQPSSMANRLSRHPIQDDFHPGREDDPVSLAEMPVRKAWALGKWTPQGLHVLERTRNQLLYSRPERQE